MAVLFDASDLLARDRVDAYDAAMNSVTFPTCSQLTDDGRNAHARIENWDLGVGINVVQAVTSGQKSSARPHRYAKPPRRTLRSA